LVVELSFSTQGSWDPELLSVRLFGVPFIQSRPGLRGVQVPRGRIAQQLLELRVELAWIDSNGLGCRRPVTLPNQTSQHTSGCAAVDWDERRLDGVVQMSKVARVLPGRTVFHEL
jgi:hypothetical protein